MGQMQGDSAEGGHRKSVVGRKIGYNSEQDNSFIMKALMDGHFVLTIDDFRYRAGRRNRKMAYRRQRNKGLSHKLNVRQPLLFPERAILAKT